MDVETKNIFDVVFSAVQLLGLIVAGVLAYYRYFREGVHKPRIEFDVQASFHGARDADRVSFVVVSAENKGNVEHKFTRITLKLLGINSTEPLKRRPDHRLDFTQPILKAEMVPAEFGYYFVRPGVKQPFTFPTTIPADIRYVLARAAFKYEGSDDLHTVERVFEIAAP